MGFKVDEKLKTDYLLFIGSEYSQSNTNAALFTLNIIDDYESMSKSKVYNLNKAKMLSLLGNFNAYSLSIITFYKSMVMQYLTYVSDTTSATGIESLQEITQEELSEIINVDLAEKKLLTKSEYIRLLNNIYGKANVQDMAILVLLWNGFRGKENIDLRKATTDIIDFDNCTLSRTFDIVVNGETKVKKQVIKIDEVERDVLYEAITSCEYHSYNKKDIEYREEIDIDENGNEFIKQIPRAGKPPKNEYVININNPYIIKVYADTENEFESDYNIKIRILNMFKFLDIKFLNIGSIYSSGILYRALEENNFTKLRYTDIRNYVNNNNYTLSSARTSEMQDLMIKKLRNEGIDIQEIPEKPKSRSNRVVLHKSENSEN